MLYYYYDYTFGILSIYMYEGVKDYVSLKRVISLKSWYTSTIGCLSYMNFI